MRPRSTPRIKARGVSSAGDCDAGTYGWWSGIAAPAGMVGGGGGPGFLFRPAPLPGAVPTFSSEPGAPPADEVSPREGTHPNPIRVETDLAVKQPGRARG